MPITDLDGMLPSSRRLANATLAPQARAGMR
jgi:hypothetical protein